MNEQQILRTLMQNPEFKKALRAMMLTDRRLAAELSIGISKPANNVYVWCAEMVDADGRVYYHPIIVPGIGGPMGIGMELDDMMDVDNYTMMASEDQFEAYEHESTVSMFRSVYGNVSVKLLAVPKETYRTLKEALNVLVSGILREAYKCFDHLDAIASMANTNADMLKMQLLASIFRSMTTVSACFDRDMNVCDSSTHNYCLEDDECEEEYYDEDNYDDEDWDDYY